MILISIEDFDCLSDDEKEIVPNNGVGKKSASYLRVRQDGNTILLQSSAMEPEDVSFHRDLKWIADWMMKMYEIGKYDGFHC